MPRRSARVFQILAWITLAGFVLQLYLGGVGAFGANTYAWHRAVGHIVGYPIYVLPIVALIGRLGRRVIGASALLFVLYMLQVILPNLRADLPYVAAFHVVNALVLMGVASAAARMAGEVPSDAKPEAVETGRWAESAARGERQHG